MMAIATEQVVASTGRKTARNLPAASRKNVTMPTVITRYVAAAA